MPSNPNQDFTHTVVCFSDANARKHFYNVFDAAAYANELLRQGKKCKIYAYRPPAHAPGRLRRRPPGTGRTALKRKGPRPSNWGARPSVVLHRPKITHLPGKVNPANVLHTQQRESPPHEFD